MDDNRSPLRLSLDTAALQANWRWCAKKSGAAECGAAIKADGYGLGAAEVMSRLIDAGCRTFFVATWAEAAALGRLPDGATLGVLHGVRADDIAAAQASGAYPVLNSLDQVARWVEHCPGRRCDLMVDTGMNRLGLAMHEIGDERLARLDIGTIMSHLACADEDSAMNAAQLARYRDVVAAFPKARHSLANSAGICLGGDYAFDLTRPGIALYGGVVRSEMAGAIRPVVTPEAAVVQLRDIAVGESVGYGATFVADRSRRIAILNIGYADGVLRMLGPDLVARWPSGIAALVLGRVSMDLIAVEAGEGAREGDWVALDFDLPQLAANHAISQYELLTGLGARFDRVWSV